MLLRDVARRYPYSLRDSKLRSNTTKANLYQDVTRLICPYHPAFPPPLIRQAMAVRADWPLRRQPLLLLRAKHWPRCWCPLLFVKSAVGIPPFPTKTLFIVFFLLFFVYCFCLLFLFVTINFLSTSLFFPPYFRHFSLHTHRFTISSNHVMPLHHTILTIRACNAQTLIQSLKKVIQKTETSLIQFSFKLFLKIL